MGFVQIYLDQRKVGGMIVGCSQISGILQVLHRHSVSPNGNVLCLYGDTSYPHWQVFQAPFKGAALTPMRTEWSKAMSKVRIEVEWVFGDIINNFAILDFKKKLKVQLSEVCKMYIVCTLMAKCKVMPLWIFNF